MAKLISGIGKSNQTGQKRDESISVFVYIAGMLIIIAMGLLLKNDFTYVMGWEAVTLVMTVLSAPLAARLFPFMEDKGWLFAKVLSILVCGYVVWLFCSTPLFSFTHGFCAIVTIVICTGAFILGKRLGKVHINVSLVVKEEIMFFAAFALWSYFIGFQAQAYGNEKFMDYGLMANIFRTDHFPSIDMWYSKGTTNYYYLGQYFSVYLAKITYTEIRIVYNMMRAFVAAFAFVLPYSLVSTLLLRRFGGIKKAVCHAGGAAAGVLMNFSGNLHYLFYGIIPYITSRLAGEEPQKYWYPDATRYIGYCPENEDKCIHEFPAYSFVEGDLHAHVINIMFVLALLGVLYAFTVEIRRDKNLSLKQLCLKSHLYVLGFMLGVFKGSNFWDFIIYYTLCAVVVFFTCLAVYECRLIKTIKYSLAVLAIMFIEGAIIILPFTMHFVSMDQGIMLCEDHSLIHQLLVLWGTPVLAVILLAIAAIISYKNEDGAKGRLGFSKRAADFFKNVNELDYFVVMLGVSAIALVLLPEIFYVKDIYTGGYKRANTMFKLTYQAFIIFCMTGAYSMFYIFVRKTGAVLKTLTAFTAVMFMFCSFYGAEAFHDWFENIFDMSKREGLDGLYYLEYNEDMTEDRDGIKWLNENIDGMHIILEADGYSYTAYERVTAMTGLATPLGWHTHEHLWRNDEEDVNSKSADVRAMYTGYDENEVKALLDEYEVEYIFVGQRERESYGDAINNSLIMSLGDIVFKDAASETYIVKLR